MKRLTIKDEYLGKFVSFTIKEGKANEAVAKLVALEDIEEELGIDLTVFYRMLRDGIWVNKMKLFYVNPCKIEFGFNIQWKEKSFWVEQDEYKFEDYGKIWALTKEKLENDKKQ